MGIEKANCLFNGFERRFSAMNVQFGDVAWGKHWRIPYKSCSFNLAKRFIFSWHNVESNIYAILNLTVQPTMFLLCKIRRKAMKSTTIRKNVKETSRWMSARPLNWRPRSLLIRASVAREFLSPSIAVSTPVSTWLITVTIESEMKSKKEISSIHIN